MRTLLQIQIPHEPFNTMVKNGTAGATIGRILEATKPEVAYFTEQDGHRGAVLVVDMPDASKIPSLAEPWFLAFQANVQFRIAMSVDDLKRSGLDDLGKRWK